MIGYTGPPSEKQKGFHRAIADIVMVVMHRAGAALALCLVAEILGRLERYCTYSGMPIEEVRIAVERNRTLGRASAQHDIDEAEGHAPAENARPL